MTDERWQVTVTVPASLSQEQLDALFDRIADAVDEWEPDDRDGWDTSVVAAPEGEEVAALRRRADELGRAHSRLVAEHQGAYAMAVEAGWDRDILVSDLARERSSRQAWAEEAMRLEMELQTRNNPGAS